MPSLSVRSSPIPDEPQAPSPDTAPPRPTAQQASTPADNPLPANLALRAPPLRAPAPKGLNRVDIRKAQQQLKELAAEEPDPPTRKQLQATHLKTLDEKARGQGRKPASAYVKRTGDATVLGNAALAVDSLGGLVGVKSPATSIFSEVPLPVPDYPVLGREVMDMGEDETPSIIDDDSGSGETETETEAAPRQDLGQQRLASWIDETRRIQQQTDGGA